MFFLHMKCRLLLNGLHCRIRQQSCSSSINYDNIPLKIQEALKEKLYLKENHPLRIVKNRIEKYCNDYALKRRQNSFQVVDALDPVVDIKKCFDDLRIPLGHVSRKPTDTYYLNQHQVLRTHTSAHQTELISKGIQAFLCTGDVYRRDEIDRSHYPIFHQMEGVRIFDSTDRTVFPPNATLHEINQLLEEDLKGILSGLAVHLFGEGIPMRWKADYFPFTEPSFELEVLFTNHGSDPSTNGTDHWMEVLGCGIIHREVLTNANQPLHKCGWAFGLGLERLAMILFAIPDIRLFWTKDIRFTSQFRNDEIVRFVPYSKYPECYKDVSFWIPSLLASEQPFHINYVYEVIRDIAGDLVEKVELFDEFTHPKTGRVSQAYRITYRSMDRNLTNPEIDELQWKVRDMLVQKLGVELR